MSDSILTSTKKTLNLDESFTAFDMDITMHINSVFSTLNQLGIGPPQGYMIVDKDDLWSAFIGTDMRMNSVKTYVYLRVRLLFDPPTTSYLLAALQDEVRELEWRLSQYREETAWTPPVPRDEPSEF